jgi:hypothetical protein
MARAVAKPSNAGQPTATARTKARTNILMSSAFSIFDLLSDLSFASGAT